MNIFVVMSMYLDTGPDTWLQPNQKMHQSMALANHYPMMPKTDQREKRSLRIYL